jgi:hypothetical protein
MKKTLLTLILGALLAALLPTLVRRAAAASNTQVHRINQS